MPLSIDAVGFYRTSGGGADTTFQTTTTATGDSLTVRSFNAQAGAQLERIMHNLPASSATRVRSPLLHDNVEGIQLYPGQNPGARSFLAAAPQVLRPQDTLIGESLIGAGTSTGATVLGIVYNDLPGSAARLHTQSDIKPLMKSIKYLRVTLASGGALGVWLDTAINATEDLLHANTDYAILGFITDTALAAIAFKGIDSGNLRIPAPGVLDENVTAEYFWAWAGATNQPRIPVFNSANKSSAYISAYDKASPTGANVQMLIAELSQNLSS